MTIRDYIQNQVFARRLQERAALVIYDPSRRYRDIALDLATDQCRVIDTSLSVIEQRELATEAMAALAEGQIHHLVIWVPAKPPQDATDRQGDPFAVFAAIGAVFPGCIRQLWHQWHPEGSTMKDHKNIQLEQKIL